MQSDEVRRFSGDGSLNGVSQIQPTMLVREVTRRIQQVLMDVATDEWLGVE